jgi:hypothetical protein
MTYPPGRAIYLPRDPAHLAALRVGVGEEDENGYRSPTSPMTRKATCTGCHADDWLFQCWCMSENTADESSRAGICVAHRVPPGQLGGAVLRKTADYRDQIFIEQGSGLAWGAGASVRMVDRLFAIAECSASWYPSPRR